MTITPPTVDYVTTGTTPKYLAEGELEGRVNTALASLATQANADIATNAASIATNTSGLSTEVANRTTADGLKADKATTLTGTGLAATSGNLGASPTVDVPKASGAEAAAGSIDTKAVTPLALATPLALKAPLASPTFTGTVTGVSKAMVGLGNVDNTDDAGKPVSTAQAAANALKADKARTVTGAGLATGGGDMTADRTLTVPKATGAQALAGTDDAAALTSLALATPLGAKADKSTAPVGAGLAVGSGTLGATPTITVPKATGAEALTGTDDAKAVTPLALATPLAGKVGTGDARLTDAREWTAATIDQATAEAGSDTTRLAWTAVRVKQAILARIAALGLGALATKSTVATTDIDVGAITNARQADMAAGTIKGRRTTLGAPQDLTLAQVKSDLALDLVDNTADTAKPVSTAQAAALAAKAPLASPAFTGTVAGITKSMVGLGSVDNTDDVSKPVSTAVAAALALRAPLASPAFTGTPTGLTKAHVGLGSVDNTADAAKPVSTAAATALALKADAAQVILDRQAFADASTYVEQTGTRETADDDILIVNRAGRTVADIPALPVGALKPEASIAYWSDPSAYGTRIDHEGRIDAGPASPSVPYVPAYHGWGWLRHPRGNGVGVDVLVSPDRRASPGRGGLWAVIDLILGFVVPADWAAKFTAIVLGYGHSDGQGSPDAAAVTTTAIDPGFALMLQALTNSTPYLGTNTPSGLVDLRHNPAPGSTALGETPYAGMHEALTAAIVAAGGTKFPIAYAAANVGGSLLTDLMETRRPDTAYWAAYQRALAYLAWYIRASGKAPILLPMVLFHFDPDKSVAAPYGRHTRAATYRRLLDRFCDMANASARARLGWHPDAPNVPIITVQGTEEPKAMWSGPSTKVFSTDTWGPEQGHFLAMLFSDGIVCSGPDYWCPHHTDNQHKTSIGYRFIGDQVGGAMAEVVLRRGFRPVSPLDVTRVNLSTIDIRYHLPFGGSLVFDTTTVADALDGFKGFLAWRSDTSAQVAISSVTLTAADTVRVVLASPGPSDGLYIDYAVWGDNQTISSGRNTVTGPRGNLRSNVAHSTPQGNRYDWAMKGSILAPDYSAASNTQTIEALMRRFL